MNRIRSSLSCVLLSIAFVCSTGQNSRKTANEEIHIPAGKESLPSEEVFKNIEILKGKPASRLPAMMKALNILLGVECTHCHVSGAWDKEQPEAKLVTRRMFRMVATVSDKYFEDKAEVTCWTCHCGHAKPADAQAETEAGLAKLTAEQRSLIAEERLGPDRDRPAEQVFQNVRIFESHPAKQLVRAMGILQSAWALTARIAISPINTTMMKRPKSKQRGKCFAWKMKSIDSFSMVSLKLSAGLVIVVRPSLRRTQNRPTEPMCTPFLNDFSCAVQLVLIGHPLQFLGILECAFFWLKTKQKLLTLCSVV